MFFSQVLMRVVNVLKQKVTQLRNSQICELMDFSIDNICIKWAERVLTQIVGIPWGTNYVPPPADWILFPYVSNNGHSAKQFNLSPDISMTSFLSTMTG